MSSSSLSLNQQQQQQQQQLQLLLERKEREIAILQERCTTLSYQLQNALQNQQQSNNSSSNNNNNNSIASSPYHNNSNKNHTKIPHHPLSPHVINVCDASASSSMMIPSSTSSSSLSNIPSTTTIQQRERIGRNASIATRRVIDQIVQQQEQQDAENIIIDTNDTDDNNSTTSNSNSSTHMNTNTNQQQQLINNKKKKLLLKKKQKKQIIMNEIITRILQMFQNPNAATEYLSSSLFASDLYTLSLQVQNIFEHEPRCIYISSPCYVFGDIHGNIEDLHFFSDNIWRLGMNVTAGNFLFLGDYVDRGLNCLETIAYLFAMKYIIPTKIYLLRGNHETRDVNGWEEHYHDKSFIYQCRKRFGNDIGYRIWEVCNSVFDRIPLAAIIDQDIFCVHGGIPRPIHQQQQQYNHNNNNNNRITMKTTRIQDILSVPKVAGINPPYEHEDEIYQQVASDCIWSDPASEQQELFHVNPNTGYGESLRGGGAICFGHVAVTNFLQEHNLSYIMRAHEAHADGVAISKGARVFTVFSTSQDHNQGSNAMAGCILVDNAKLQVINRSPAYKNQYVHRRDSISVASLSEQEIQRRIQLGLIKPSLNGDHHNNNSHGSSSHIETTNTVTTNTTSTNDVELDDWQDITDQDLNPPNNNNDDDDNDNEDDINLTDLDSEQNKTTTYALDPNRRSSIDLGHLSINIHDESILANNNNSDNNIPTTNGVGTTVSIINNLLDNNLHTNPNKRQRYRQPSIASISEEEPALLGQNTNDNNKNNNTNTMDDDDDEVATVDGNIDEDNDMEDIE